MFNRNKTDDNETKELADKMKSVLLEKCFEVVETMFKNCQESLKDLESDLHAITRMERIHNEYTIHPLVKADLEKELTNMLLGKARAGLQKDFSEGLNSLNNIQIKLWK